MGQKKKVIIEIGQLTLNMLSIQTLEWQEVRHEAEMFFFFQSTGYSRGPLSYVKLYFGLTEVVLGIFKGNWRSI